ncbi:MAG: EamA family transporter [Alphaproteobacteria bacterium]|nr:EamA family transporter [Alphaproteobacteria bacterium]
MNIKQMLLAMLPPALWGASYAVIKLGLKEFPPFFMLAIGFSFPAILLIPFFKVLKKDIPLIIATSFLKIVGGIGLITLAQLELDASTGAVLEQLLVPFAIILSAIFFNDYICLKKIIGIILSFAGVIVISGEPSMPGIAPLIYMVAAAFLIALTMIMVKKIEKDNGKITVKGALALNGWISLFALPPLFLISFIYEKGQLEALISASSWGWTSIIYVGVINIIIASSIWFYLIGTCKISNVAPFSMVAPASGLLAGIALWGETLTIEKIVGGLLIIAGVALINAFTTDKGYRRHAKDLVMH